MARLINGVRIWINNEDRHHATGYTRYSVRSLSSTIYEVTVDAENLWTCSCKSAKFRNLCYHILAVKSEIERIVTLKRLKRVPSTPVNRRDFNEYLAMQRFIAEPIFAGPREFVVFGRRVWLEKKRKVEWEYPDESHIKLAGTILEGVWDRYGVKVPTFYLIDCLFHKGMDYRFSPLGFRKDLLNTIASKWSPDNVLVSPYAYGEDEKLQLLRDNGCCMIKDINSTYDRENQGPRAWMEVQYGKADREDADLG